MRLIYADELTKITIKSLEQNPHSDPIHKAMHKHEHNHFLTLIDSVPTVDAVEVVHGRLDNERVVEAIEQLSDIRAQYDYYNPDEIRKCHALTFAIVMLNDVLGERRSGDEKY